MGYPILINTDASSISRALYASITPSLPEFVLGDSREIDIYVVNGAGAYQDYSGSTAYDVTAAIGNAGAIPTSGTFTLTYGADTTAALAYNATSAAVETALNALASVTSAGGLDVIGTTGGFRITFRSVGTRTDITGDGGELYPQSSVFAMNAEPGDGSTRCIQLLRIRQSVVAYCDAWTQILDPDDGVTPIGWRGIIDTNTVEAALALGDLASTASLELEVQLVRGSDSMTSTILQQSITLRNDLIDPSTLTTVNLPTYLTPTAGDARYCQRSNNLSDLDDADAARQNLDLGGVVSTYAVAFLIAGAKYVFGSPICTSTTVIACTQSASLGSFSIAYYTGQTIGSALSGSPVSFVVFDFASGTASILGLDVDSGASTVSLTDYELIDCGAITFTDSTASEDTRENLGLPLCNYAATAAPGTGDDTGDGYGVGSNWYDVTNDDAYVCLDATAGAAVWKKTTP
jgi:hypothetical protein